tara:strand:+ start:131 stop:787 length:657 start_codon:yes stop_codon:yes gene_type:complete
MNIEINIPDNLNEITLGQYQEFLKIEEPTEEDILKVFLNLDLKGIGKVKAADVDKYAAHITSLFEQEQRHSLKFNLKGVEFGFLPNLDDITYGENKDVTAYLNDWQSMHKAMSVLYRPITQKLSGKYLIEGYEGSHKYSETMKQMPLGVVMGSMVFFYNLTNELLKAIPNYLEKEAMKEQMKGQISEQNGEAIKKYTHLLKETLGDLAKLQTYPYTLA